MFVCVVQLEADVWLNGRKIRRQAVSNHPHLVGEPVSAEGSEGARGVRTDLGHALDIRHSLELERLRGGALTGLEVSRAQEDVARLGADKNRTVYSKRDVLGRSVRCDDLRVLRMVCVPERR